jgi:hypothetical protein
MVYVMKFTRLEEINYISVYFNTLIVIKNISDTTIALVSPKYMKIMLGYILSAQEIATTNLICYQDI